MQEQSGTFEPVLVQLGGGKALGLCFQRLHVLLQFGRVGLFGARSGKDAPGPLPHLRGQ